MKALKNIIDTWSMIEKYGIKGYTIQDDSTVLIPSDEYSRLLNAVVNKRYIRNLSK